MFDRICDEPRGAVQGRIAEIVEILQAKLRRLRGDLVLRAALRIDPERRRRLKAAGEGDQHIARHRLLGQPDQLRLAAVDIDVELRIVARLLDMQIDRAGNGVQFLQQRDWQTRGCLPH